MPRSTVSVKRHLYPKYLIGAIWNRMRNVDVATCAIYRANNNNNKNSKHSPTISLGSVSVLPLSSLLRCERSFSLDWITLSAQNTSTKIGSKSNQPAACSLFSFGVLSIVRDAHSFTSYVPPSISCFIRILNIGCWIEWMALWCSSLLSV